ncbi:MAG: hypothetical protein CMJ78_16500 [Planctomycetaceae bacterium]|nr:hypothetical protein [Planctomycetaceae bacterium]
MQAFHDSAARDVHTANAHADLSHNVFDHMALDAAQPKRTPRFLGDGICTRAEAQRNTSRRYSISKSLEMPASA